MISGLETFADRAAWLAARRSGVGSSDAAALLYHGFDGRGPLHVYAEKVGAAAAEVPEAAHLRRGRHLEPSVASWYAEEFDVDVRPFAEGFYMFRDPDDPWRIATPDRYIHNDDGTPVTLLELKTVSWTQTDDWADGVPIGYWVQVQHQLAVCRVRRGLVGVLFLGEDTVRSYVVDGDPEFQEMLRRAEAEFWDRVQRRDPPPAVRADDVDPLQRLYHAGGGPPVALPPEAVEVADLYEDAKRRERDAYDAKCVAKAKFLSWLGDAASGELPDGRFVSAKAVHVETHTKTVSAYDYRDVRIKAPKR